IPRQIPRELIRDPGIFAQLHLRPRPPAGATRKTGRRSQKKGYKYIYFARGIRINVLIPFSTLLVTIPPRRRADLLAGIMASDEMPPVHGRGRVVRAAVRNHGNVVGAQLHAGWRWLAGAPSG